MCEFPNEVIEIHARFLTDFSEFDDHTFSRIDAANDTFDVERFRQTNLREKFCARPELFVRFQIHSRCADVAKRRVQSDFTPGDFDLCLAGVTRMSAALGFAQSGCPLKNDGPQVLVVKGMLCRREVRVNGYKRAVREGRIVRCARWSIIPG